MIPYYQMIRRITYAFRRIFVLGGFPRGGAKQKRAQNIFKKSFLENFLMSNDDAPGYVSRDPAERTYGTFPAVFSGSTSWVLPDIQPDHRTTAYLGHTSSPRTKNICDKYRTIHLK